MWRPVFFMPIFLISLFFLEGLSGCTNRAHTPPQAGGLQKGRTYDIATRRKDLGFERSYLLHVPADWDGKSSMPVVVALHGAFMTGGEMEAQTGLSTLADTQGFAVIYPQGVGIMGYLQHWNAGFCCAKAQEAGVDDLGFLDICLADAGSRLPLDKERLYMLGISNGGMLAYHYALHGRRKLAGIAVIAGAMDGASHIEPQREYALPVCIIHGLADESLPYKGGRFRNGENGPVFLAQKETAAWWAASDGCQGETVARSLFAGYVQEQEWERCATGAGVRFYSVRDMRHGWAGGDKTAHLPLANGKAFDAAALAWDWLRSFRRSGGGFIRQAQ